MSQQVVARRRGGLQAAGRQLIALLLAVIFSILVWVPTVTCEFIARRGRSILARIGAFIIRLALP